MGQVLLRQACMLLKSFKWGKFKRAYIVLSYICWLFPFYKQICVTLSMTKALRIRLSCIELPMVTCNCGINYKNKKHVMHESEKPKNCNLIY